MTITPYSQLPSSAFVNTSGMTPVPGAPGEYFNKNGGIQWGNDITPITDNQVRQQYLSASPQEQQALLNQLTPTNAQGSSAMGLDDYINAATGNPNRGPRGLLGALQPIAAVALPIAGIAGGPSLLGAALGDSGTEAGMAGGVGSGAFGPATDISNQFGAAAADAGIAPTIGSLGSAGGITTAASSPFISAAKLGAGLASLGNGSNSPPNTASVASFVPQVAPTQQVIGPTQQQPSRQLQPYAGAPAYQSYNQPSATQQMMAAALGQNVQNAQRPAPVGIGFGLNQNPQTYGLA